MFKIMSTILLFALLTACSAQEDHETNSSKAKEEVKRVEAPKELVQKKVVQKSQKEDNRTQTPKASLFTLTTLEGKTIHIDETKGGLAFKEYKDKAVLLLFFGHRCPPCLAEIPVLTALTNKGHKDLEIIAIEVQGYSAEQLKEFKKQKGINYNLVTYDNGVNLVNYIAKQAQWSGAIPFLVGFDTKTVVQIVHAGGLRANSFDKIYTTLTKGE